MTYNELVLALIHETPNYGDMSRIMWEATCGEGYETQENKQENKR